MTDTEIRTEFDALAQRLREQGHADAAARTELLREWLANPDFRQQLSDYVWQINAAR